MSGEACQFISTDSENECVEALSKLRKFLEAIAVDGFVNAEQLQDASMEWIAQIDSFMLWVGNLEIENQIIELRSSKRKFEEENNTLREEIIRGQEKISLLQRQKNMFQRELDLCTKKCQQFEKENDDQRDTLNHLICEESSSKVSLKRLVTEHKILQRKLEANEQEIQTIALLKIELKEERKKTMALTMQMRKMEYNCEEKQQQYESLKSRTEILERNFTALHEDQQQTIHDLREKNRQLMDENLELRSMSLHNMSISDDKGFTTECNINDSKIQELEEELNEYDNAICMILEQLQNIIEKLGKKWKTSCAPVLRSEDIEKPRIQNFEELNQKMSFLSDMVTEITSKTVSNVDCGTQIKAQVLQDQYEEYGIVSYRKLLEYTHSLNIRTAPVFATSRNETYVIEKKVPQQLLQYDWKHHPTREIEQRIEISNIDTTSSSMIVPVSFSTPILKNRHSISRKRRRIISDDISEEMQETKQDLANNTSLCNCILMQTSISEKGNDGIVNQTVNSNGLTEIEDSFIAKNEPTIELENEKQVTPTNNRSHNLDLENFSDTDKYFSIQSEYLSNISICENTTKEWKFRRKMLQYPLYTARKLISRKSVLWCVVISLLILLGISTLNPITSTNGCDISLKRWYSIEELLLSHLQSRKRLPPPI